MVQFGKIENKKIRKYLLKSMAYVIIPRGIILKRFIFCKFLILKGNYNLAQNLYIFVLRKVGFFNCFCGSENPENERQASWLFGLPKKAPFF